MKMKYKFVALVAMAAILGVGILRWSQQAKQPDLIAGELVTQIMTARSALPKFRTRLEHPLAGDRSFFLRAQFTDKKNVEFLWLNAVHIEGDNFSAKVAQQPIIVPGIHLGDRVTVNEADVVDWTIKHNDGSLEGNYTQGLEPNRH